MVACLLVNDLRHVPGSPHLAQSSLTYRLGMSYIYEFLSKAQLEDCELWPHIPSVSATGDPKQTETGEQITLI